MRKIETLELQPDESMVTAEGREGRRLSLDAVGIAYYGRSNDGWLTTQQYRICQCMQGDLEAVRSTGGGGGLGRYGEAFVPLPRATGARRADHGIDAAARLERCRKGIGADLAHAMLTEFVRDGFSYAVLAKRWKMDHRKAKATLLMALDRIIDAKVYERDQWTRAQVWAEAAA